MFDDAEHGAGRAMAAESACAPFAVAAGQIDFAGDPLPDPLWHPRAAATTSPTNSWPGVPREAVVSALQFQIGGADSGGKQADAGEALRDARQWLAAHFDASVFEMNGEHAGLYLRICLPACRPNWSASSASCRERVPDHRRSVQLPEMRRTDGSRLQRPAARAPAELRGSVPRSAA